MPHYVAAPIVEGFWSALNAKRAEPRASWKAAVPGILKATAADGWIGRIEIESVLLGTDASPLHLRTDDLLAAFEIVPQWTFPRPGLSSSTYGIERVDAFDFAGFLIRLERAGFAIDPTPLCEALRPQLAKRRFLTSAQVSVLWQRRERHRSEPLTIATGPNLTFGPPDASLDTATGYRADLWRNAAGEAAALKVTTPKRRRAAHPLAA